MIKMDKTGRKMVFTGKDQKLVKQYAKEYDMSFRDFVIGTLWVSIMHKKREERKNKGGL